MLLNIQNHELTLSQSPAVIMKSQKDYKSIQILKYRINIGVKSLKNRTGQACTVNLSYVYNIYERSPKININYKIYLKQKVHTALNLQCG